jgi:hypothetical protein
MIPHTFQLAGRRWKVKRITRKMLDRMTDAADLPQAVGLCSPQSATIYLAKDIDGDLLEISFEHELEHAVRFTQGKDDHDEADVDGVAQLRHQFKKTARYKE